MHFQPFHDGAGGYRVLLLCSRTGRPVDRAPRLCPWIAIAYLLGFAIVPKLAYSSLSLNAFRRADTLAPNRSARALRVRESPEIRTGNSQMPHDSRSAAFQLTLWG